MLPAMGLGVALLSASASSGADELPPPEKLRYSIIRAGDEIGSEEIELSRDGSRYRMTGRLNIAVRLYGITIRRLENTMSEEWVAGRFRSFASSTDEDGARHDLRIEIIDPDEIHDHRNTLLIRQTRLVELRPQLRD